MNNQDRELLELAAKAADYSPEIHQGNVWINGDYHSPKSTTPWRPHEDDEACARLEAKLEIDILWYPAVQIVQAMAQGCSAQESYGDDRQKARRLSSVRVAAEIGRRMK